jgi:hypothetical protein
LYRPLFSYAAPLTKELFHLTPLQVFLS